MNNLYNLNQSDNFFIVGKWGTSTDNMVYGGYVDFKDQNISIFISGLKDYDYIKIYGEGTLFIKDNNMNKTVGYFKCTLNECFLNLNVGAAMSMSIGNKFINDESSFDKLLVSMTNFSNWINTSNFSPVNSTYDATNNTRKQESYNYDNKKFKTKIDHNVSVNITSVIRDLRELDTNYYIYNMSVRNFFEFLFDEGVSKNDIDKCVGKILSWYCLVSGYGEHLSKTIAFINDSEIDVFYSKNYKNNVMVREYRLENASNPRNDEFMKNILLSIKYWFNQYDFFSNVFFNGVNPYEIGTDLQKVQNDCVAIDILTKNYIPKIRKQKNRSYKKKQPGVYYRDKAKFFLELESKNDETTNNIVSESFKHVQYSNYDELAKKITNCRNELSHGPDLNGDGYKRQFSFNENMYIHYALRDLIRNWLLKEIRIKHTYINSYVEESKWGTMKMVGGKD